jgi:hypothetical protein
MLLLLLSALVAGTVIGVPILLFVFAMAAGLFVFAAAIGIPFATLVTCLAVGGNVSRLTSKPHMLDERGPGNPWFIAYLEWIKRVAQGEKDQVDGHEGTPRRRRRT